MGTRRRCSTNPPTEHVRQASARCACRCRRSPPCKPPASSSGPARFRSTAGQGGAADAALRLVVGEVRREECLDPSRPSRSALRRANQCRRHLHQVRAAGRSVGFDPRGVPRNWSATRRVPSFVVRRDAEVRADRSVISPRIGSPSGPPAGSASAAYRRVGPHPPRRGLEREPLSPIDKALLALPPPVGSPAGAQCCRWAHFASSEGHPLVVSRLGDCPTPSLR